MTFTEAAVEILRLVGRPLHYKKITELAIERNLLSHVGKAPELTMSSRLATMVKKDRGEEPIVKVKPGVFALREFTPEMLALAESDEDIDLSALPPPATTKPEPVAAAPVEGEGGELIAPPAAAPRRALPGSDVFPEEEDDNEPILAGLDDEEEDDEGDDRGEGRRRGRRRRRRGRKGEGDEMGAAEETTEGEAREAREEQSRDRDRDRGRDRGRDRDRDRDRGRDRDRDRGGPRLPQVDLAREPQQDDLVGRDLADAVYSVMSQGEMSPQSYTQIAEQLVRRGRLVGDPGSLAPTVSAAIRADHRRRERARFRYVEGRVALVDWYLPRDAVRQEKDVIRFAERQRDQIRRAFLGKLQQLPTAGFVEILATWLNAEGVSGLRAVRRPGSGSQEIHLAGVLRRGPEETRVAVVLLRGGGEVQREKVVELRGSLHHYGAASTGWIVSTGPVSRGAREEANVAATTPIAVFDGSALAEAMESRRIGLVPVSVPMSAVDLDLLDALRGGPERVERGGDRDRDRGGGRDREHAPAGEGAEAASEPALAEAAPEAGEAGVVAETTEAGAEVQATQPGEGGGRRRRRRRRRGRGAQGESPAPGIAEGAEIDEDAEGEDGGADEAVEPAAEAAPSQADVEVSDDEDERAGAFDDEGEGAVRDQTTFEDEDADLEQDEDVPAETSDEDDEDDEDDG